MTFDIEAAPRWLREFDQALAIRPCIVLSGNVHDTSLLPIGDQHVPVSNVEAAIRLLAMRSTPTLCWDPTGSFTLSEPERTAAVLTMVRDRIRTGAELPHSVAVGAIPDWAAVVQASMEPMALMIQFASRLSSDPARLEPEAHALFLRLYKLIQSCPERRSPDLSGRPSFNPLVLLVEKIQDLPSWFLVGNARIRDVAIPLPDYDTRLAAARRSVRRLKDFSAHDPQLQARTAEIVAEQTSGLPLRAIDQIVNLCRRYDLPVLQVPEAVRRFRIGLPDNPWAQSYLRQRIKDAGNLLRKSVEGQDHAIRLAQAVLTRAYTGLTGAQTGRERSKPRGVLFFAGPTGVGKTELARAITRLLFNDDRACVRFDMSEFASEHAEARLIGAPPGYVGYDSGGELVNAVRQQPFSLLLFDEIDKADRSILDKFLQILDEGRLTDGRGETAYFSECIIVFTSNLGIYRDTPQGKLLIAKIEDPPSVTRMNVMREIRRVFREDLGRPELLNRIGDNIVVFDFITPEVAGRIAQKMLHSVAERVRVEMGLALTIDEQVRERLVGMAVEGREDGGRGVGNRLESIFVNPLAEALLQLGAERGARVRVTGLIANGNATEVQVRCI